MEGRGELDAPPGEDVRTSDVHAVGLDPLFCEPVGDLEVGDYLTLVVLRDLHGITHVIAVAVAHENGLHLDVRRLHLGVGVAVEEGVHDDPVPVPFQLETGMAVISQLQHGNLLLHAALKWPARGQGSMPCQRRTHRDFPRPRRVLVTLFLQPLRRFALGLRQGTLLPRAFENLAEPGADGPAEGGARHTGLHVGHSRKGRSVEGRVRQGLSRGQGKGGVVQPQGDGAVLQEGSPPSLLRAPHDLPPPHRDLPLGGDQEARRPARRSDGRRALAQGHVEPEGAEGLREGLGDEAVGLHQTQVGEGGQVQSAHHRVGHLVVVQDRLPTRGTAHHVEARGAADTPPRTCLQGAGGSRWTGTPGTSRRA